MTEQPAPTALLERLSPTRATAGVAASGCRGNLPGAAPGPGGRGPARRRAGHNEVLLREELGETPQLGEYAHAFPSSPLRSGASLKCMTRWSRGAAHARANGGLVAFLVAGDGRRRRRTPRRARLRDPGRAGPRRHGRRLPGPADGAQPPGRPEDDPGRRPRRRRTSWPASAPRPRRSPACSTPTSCRSTRSASTTGRPFFSLEFVRRRQPGPEARRHAAAAAAGGARWSRRWRGPCTHAHQQRHRPPRPEAGQRAADGGRHAQDHRLRPGQAAGRGRGPDAQPGPSWARPATWPPSRPAGESRRSARPPTSTRWARSSTSC